MADERASDRSKSPGHGIPWGEVSIVFALPALFLVSAALSPLSDKHRTVWMAATLIVTVGAFALSMIMFLRRSSDRRGSRTLSPRQRKVAVFSCLTAAVACATRLPFLGDCPFYWDTCFYFNAIDVACKGFSFNPSSFLNGFRLCGHFSYGYGMLAGVGRYLTPDSVVGVQLVDMTLLALALAFLVKTTCDLLPEVPPASVFLGVSLIGFEPLLYGTFGSVNVDVPLVALTLLLVSAAHEKRYVLTAFLAFLVMTTKEVGIVFVAFAVIGEAIVALRSRGDVGRRPSGRPHARLLGSLCVGLICAAAFWAVARIFMGTGASWDQGSTSGPIFLVDFSPFPSFGLFFETYLLLVLKSIFIFNFAWLFSLVCLVGLLLEIVRGPGGRPVTKLIFGNDELVAYFSGVVGLVLFNALYYTINNVRYHAPIESALIFLAALVILVHARRRAVSLSLVGLLLACCVTEAFTTIDPLTLRLFPHVETGRDETLVSTDILVRASCPDTTAYNRQYFAQEHAIDEFLATCGYADADAPDIIVWADYPNANIYTSLSGGRSMTDSMGLRWNLVTHARVLTESTTDSVPIEWMSEEGWEAARQAGTLKAHAVLAMPEQFFGDEAFEQAKALLSQSYDVVAEGVTPGGIRYLDLTLRSS